MGLSKMSNVQLISISYPQFRGFLKKNTVLTMQQVNFYCHNYRVYDRSLKRLSFAQNTKTRKQICRMQDHIGNSMAAARTLVLVETYRKETNPKTKSKANEPKITAHEIEELAMQVKFFTKTEEKHTLGVINNLGKKRPILIAGPILAARAQIAADIWISGIGRNEYDYSNKGLSTHKAIADVVQCINNGYKYWVYLDLKDAYPSVRRSHLKEMTVVSKKVVDTLIPTTQITIKHTTPIEAPQLSLPQGIAASSRIMSAFVGYHFRSLAEMDVVYMSYVDDMLIGARTMEEVTLATKTLIKRYKDHKAGALHFGKVQVKDLNYQNQLLNFVGYGVNVDYFTKEVRVRPNIISFNKFYDQLLDRIDEAYHSGQDIQDVAYAYAEDWRCSFKMWEFNEYAKNIHFCKVDEILEEFEMAGYSKTGMVAFKKLNTKMFQMQSLKKVEKIS